MQLRDHGQRRDFFMVDPRLLKTDAGFNVRDLESSDERPALDELKESVRANGVKMPLEIRLRDDDILITSGHRRHKVVMELIAEGEEIAKIPVIQEPAKTSETDRIVNLVVSNSGKPLTPLQTSEVVRRLKAFGWDNPQIAKRLGWKSTASVNQALDMLALPEANKQQVRDGDVSASLAVKLAKDDPDLAAKLIRENAEENARLKGNRRVTAKTIQRASPKGAKEKDHGQSQQRAPVQAETAAPVASPVQRLSILPETRAEPEGSTEVRVVAAPSIDPHPVEPASGSFQQRAKPLIDALAPFAAIAQDQDFNERSDDDVVEVPFKHLKQAWVVFASVTGEWQ